MSVEPMSDERLVQIGARASWLFQVTYQGGGSPQEDIRYLLAEVDRLRASERDYFRKWQDATLELAAARSQDSA